MGGAAIAIENDADMVRHRSSPDLTPEAIFVQTIERWCH